MLPGNVRFLESAARELRSLTDTDRGGVVHALTSLACKGPPPDTRRVPVTLPLDGKTIELLIFGFDIAGYRILFVGERIVTRSKEGWDLVRGMPRAGEGFVYTIWAIVKMSPDGSS